MDLIFFNEFGFFVPFNGIEWYIKLPLRVPLSPAEISLNGPMVLNDTECYSSVISGIPLALFVRVIPRVLIYGQVAAKQTSRTQLTYFFRNIR